MRIGKVGVDQSKLRCLPVHRIGKGLHRAGMILCQRHRRIVAGVEQKAIEQLLHRAALPFPEIKRGALRIRSLRRDRNKLRERAIFCNQKTRHDLGRTGNQ